MNYLIGIDLGGTKINGVILRENQAEPVVQRKISTDGKAGADAVIGRIAQLCGDLCQEAGLSLDAVSAIGVGAPACIDYDNGRTLLVPNIPGEWYGKPVKADLEAHVNRPVWLLNDARAFTLAEARLGVAKDYPVVACFTLGTGIGGGIAIKGKLHLGLEGAAGEFGHTTVHVDGPPDGSNTPGAIEAYGSGPAVASAAVKAVMQGIDTLIADLAEHDLNKITPHTVMQAAMQGDEVALRILDDAGKHIGAGVANVVSILAPHCVVFGGGLTSLGDWLLNPIKKYLRVYCNVLNLDNLAILTAELGDDAGAIGAAVWAQQQEAGRS